MIQYLLPAKEKRINEESLPPPESRKRGKIIGVAHNIWKVYMGHPRKVVRIIVFFACSIAVLFQKYGLGNNIRWTSEWKNFPFENATLSEFWGEATYTAKEVIWVYGLNRRPENVQIRSGLYYMAGQCHTILPLMETSTAGLGVGYSFLLKHSDPGVDEAGWEVFVHEPNEPWTESGMQGSGSSEGVWMDVEEEMHLKITAQHIKTISHKQNICDDNLSYSVNKCQTLCRWTKLASIVGCTAPWMESVKNDTIGKKYKECANYHDTRELVSEYLRQGGLSSSFTATSSADNETQEEGDAYGCQASCLRPCQVTQYTTFVVNRKSISGGREKRSAVVGGAKRHAISAHQQQYDRNGINYAEKEGVLGVSDIERNVTEQSVVEDQLDPWNEEIQVFHRLSNDYFLAKKNDEIENPAEKTAERTVSFSKINVFYTSKMVTVMEENWGYDFSQFVADAGGSLGFLLGMSVVGAVALLEQLAEALVTSASGSEESSGDGDSNEKSVVEMSVEGSVVPYEEMRNKF